MAENRREAGIMVSEIVFSNFPLLFRAAGLSFFILDCEHGGFDYKDAAAMLTVAKLCGVRSIVRLPGNQRKDIVKLMDMGADGLLLPMTNTAEDIGLVVRYAKYRPLGERGISTMRAHTMYAPPPIREYTAQANAHTRIYAQIETRAGVQNAEAILSVPGVAGCFIGPNDLSDDFGCLGQKNAVPVLGAIARVCSAVEKCGKECGIITADAGYLSAAKGQGCTLFCCGSELNAVKEYAANVVANISQ